jgi:hypothetical protein
MEEIVSRFCGGEIRGRWRSVLREVIALAKSTGRLEAAYIFGGFVTAKAAPADIDLFLVMSRDFSSNQVVGVLACCLIVVEPPSCGEYAYTGLRLAQTVSPSSRLGNFSEAAVNKGL